MIHVRFSPEELEGEQREFWDRWSAKARAAKQRLLDAHRAGEPIEFENSIWAQLKHWLFEHVFHRKCAYCEGTVRPQSWGAAEHWRPKAGVSVRTGAREQPVLLNDGTTHPGYFWLAYDWENLLPACDTCNAGRGKGTQFPVARQHVGSPEQGLESAQLDAHEQPLLLHPFHDGDLDPAKHIEFDEFGIPHPRNGSHRGAVSIAVLRLDRDDLNDDRRLHFENIALHVDDAIGVAAKRLSTVRERLEPHVSMRQPYSLAAKDFVRHYFPKALSRLTAETLP